ncbi:MAG: hypothetical protein L0271_17740 [Gemmatimonadetes bacterium]|nr:hypothetical protein [Gemmatimonadota bacterium]
MKDERARLDPQLRCQLRDIPEVEDVGCTEEGVWLICRTPSGAGAAAQEAADVLGRREPPLDLPIRTAVLMGTRRESRLRFQSAERYDEPEVRVRFRIALYREGSRVWGEAVGEKGEVLELRTAALATVDAIQRAAGKQLDVRLAGIKRVRVFDADLMVVSFSRTGPAAQRFVGAVVIGNDVWRAAALAVLHALNRVLGNVLATR